MPKQTFFNLPDEKRDQLLEIAIDEFAENDYANTSVSRIVARAGIAKGSFYQYFADKQDLYAYLLGLLANAKTEFLSLEHPDPQHVGIFAYLRWTVEAGTSFELAYPKLTQIGLRSTNTRSLPKDFSAQMRGATLAFYRRLVEVGKEQGDIAAGIDLGLAAVIFDAVLSNVGHYVLESVAGEGAVTTTDTRVLLERPEVRELFNQTVTILERGMGRCMETQGGE